MLSALDEAVTLRRSQKVNVSALANMTETGDDPGHTREPCYDRFSDEGVTAMGLFARIKAVWYALLDKSVTEMEDKHDLSSDIGAILSRVDDQIDDARARSKVASDLSDQRVDVLKAKLKANRFQARELLEQFKIEQGLLETPPTPTQKTVGPQRQATPESD